MPSTYFSGEDALNFGVPDATQAQVLQASSIIDGFLLRREGLVWNQDFLGNPCYMEGLSPLLTIKTQNQILPGMSVTVSYIGPDLNSSHVGDVLVIDRSDSTKTESCVIQSIGVGTVTLELVKSQHDALSSLDLGLVILEQFDLPSNRSVGRLARFPNIKLLSGMGRYSYGRRSDQIRGNFAEFNLLATVQTFGGPPQWVPFSVNQVDINHATGEIWVPSGILLSCFSDVKVRYVAGWSSDNLPWQIKQACAQIILATKDIPLTASVKGIRDQTTGLSVDRFTSSLLSNDVKSLLYPFRARCLA